MIRQASHHDFDFIYEAIVQSEYSGGDIFPYRSLFGMTPTELKETVFKIFEEDIEGMPWHYEYWYINELNSRPAGALCSWVESADGLSSYLIHAQTLSFLLPTQWQEAKKKLESLSSVTIPRMNGYVQLEHLYTSQDFRGRGIMKELMQFIFETNPGKPFEIQVLKGNIKAVSLYEYMGFSVQNEKCNPDIKNLALLSSDCKLQPTKIT
jgi:ribosomal protein S18 acetylase RimI-like enzyme